MSGPELSGPPGAGSAGAGPELSGPERFDRYVERCLYDPTSGFYAAHGQAGGSRGDFLTSPEVGPLFGHLIGRYLDTVWRDLGEPAPFTVVECGAGRATLARAVLSSGPECLAALSYVCVERSERLRAGARDLLGESAGGAVVVCGSLEEVEAPFVGVLMANELLDNLAFRLIVRDGGGWAEVFVVDGAPVLGEFDGSGGPIDVDAPAGTRLPLQDEAASWVGDALERLEAGRLLIIDYGVATTAELIGRDWLRTYRGHDRGSDPFETPGSCDITTDVAFDQLPAATSLRTQAQFLADLGIDELVAEGKALWNERAHLGDLAAIKARSRIVEAEGLTDPHSLGAFLVAEWVV